MRQTMGKILKMHQTGNEKSKKRQKNFKIEKPDQKLLEAWDRVTEFPEEMTARLQVTI